MHRIKYMIFWNTVHIGILWSSIRPSNGDQYDLTNAYNNLLKNSRSSWQLEVWRKPTFQFFDFINHTIALQKFNYYGIDTISLEWFEKCMRQQYNVIQDTIMLFVGLNIWFFVISTWF